MAYRLIIEGNSVYEIDEECEMRKQKETKERDNKDSSMGSSQFSHNKGKQ